MTSTPSRAPLTILSVSYPFAPVSTHTAGGAEQILASIERALVARGHRSLVAAAQGSTVAGTLLPTPIPAGLIDDTARSQVTAAHQRSIDRAFATTAIDLVHMHGIDFASYTLPESVPVLVTLHMPPAWYPDAIWRLPPNIHLQCVSETQRQSCPAPHRHRLHVIPNGVPLTPEDDADDDPAAHTAVGLGEQDEQAHGACLMLARICPEKNLHIGLDAARLAGIPALLCGETFPYEAHLRYLRDEIEPRLGPHARLLGAVDPARKHRLLAAARCLLLPTLAPETSSLVAMESLAAGTPVIAFPSGAIPEIVDHGRTGFLVHSTEEMAAAILRSPELDRDLCRRTARARFSRDRMVADYLALFTRLTAATREAAHA